MNPLLAILQEMIHETSIVSTLALVAQNQCTESNQDHDYLQVMTRDDPGDDVLIFVDTNFC